MGGYFVCGMTVSLSMHFIAFATDHGYEHADAVMAQGAMAVVIFCGALLAGMVSDRIGRKMCLVWRMLCALWLLALSCCGIIG